MSAWARGCPAAAPRDQRQSTPIIRQMTPRFMSYPPNNRRSSYDTTALTQERCRINLVGMHRGTPSLSPYLAPYTITILSNIYTSTVTSLTLTGIGLAYNWRRAVSVPALMAGSARP